MDEFLEPLALGIVQINGQPHRCFRDGNHPVLGAFAQPELKFNPILILFRHPEIPDGAFSLIVQRGSRIQGDHRVLAPGWGYFLGLFQALLFLVSILNIGFGAGFYVFNIGKFDIYPVAVGKNPVIDLFLEGDFHVHEISIVNNVDFLDNRGVEFQLALINVKINVIDSHDNKLIVILLGIKNVRNGNDSVGFEV